MSLSSVVTKPNLWLSEGRSVVSFPIPFRGEAKVQLIAQQACSKDVVPWQGKGYICPRIYYSLNFLESGYWTANVTSQWVLLFRFYVYVGLEATNLLGVNKYLAELLRLTAKQKICLSETKKNQNKQTLFLFIVSFAI